MMKPDTVLEKERAAVPATRSLVELKNAAAGCRACPLWQTGTQTVFGEGVRKATILFVGEQPGNDEDRAGRPFVGPAGRILDRALKASGISRNEVFVTNAVKHFKWEPRGKRRIHKKPNAREIAACRPWLDAEIAAVKPKVIVCLGATAAQAFLGRAFRVGRDRGVFIEGVANARLLATVHPSSILRIPDAEARHEEMDRFIEDLKQVAAAR